MKKKNAFFRKLIFTLILIMEVLHGYSQKLDTPTYNLNSFKFDIPKSNSSGITKTVDDFSGKITYRINSLNISVTKVKSGHRSVYYLSLATFDSYCSVGGTGVYILFTDGTKWSRKDENIDTDVASSGGFMYSAFIKLSSEDLKMLSTKTVSKFKLYIFTQNIEKNKAEGIREDIKIIKSK